MKKSRFLVYGILIGVLCAVARAEDVPFSQDRPHISTLRWLSINRSVLNRTKAEYQALLDKNRVSPSEDSAKRLSALEYKIRALKEDAERLRSQLDQKANADDFLKQVVKRGNKIDQMHEKALSFLAEGDFDKAERSYEEIVLLNPDDDEAYLLLGHTRLAAGRYKKAAEAFGGAIQIDPDNAREIPRMYENILVENPSDDETMAQLGFAYLLLGDRVSAKKSLQSALEINPENTVAQKGLSELRAAG